MVITFTAPCPQCGTDVLWQQVAASGAFNYDPKDITIMCPCDRAHAA